MLEHKDKLRDYKLHAEQQHIAPDFKSFKEVVMRQVLFTLFGLYPHKLTKEQRAAFTIAHRLERKTPVIVDDIWLSQVDIIIDGEHVGTFVEDRRSGIIVWRVKR